MIGVIVWWVCLAPRNISSAFVLTLGNKVTLYCTVYCIIDNAKLKLVSPKMLGYGRWPPAKPDEGAISINSFACFGSCKKFVYILLPFPRFAGSLTFQPKLPSTLAWTTTKQFGGKTARHSIRKTNPAKHKTTYRRQWIQVYFFHCQKVAAFAGNDHKTGDHYARTLGQLVYSPSSQCVVQLWVQTKPLHTCGSQSLISAWTYIYRSMNLGDWNQGNRNLQNRRLAK